MSIEDKIIAKHKQLEWAERTANICYGSWDSAADTILFSDGAMEVLGANSSETYAFKSFLSLVLPEDMMIEV